MYCTDDMQTSTFLCCRLYQPMSPKNISIHTRCTSPNPQSPRYPCIESTLDYPTVQPHIHDVYVVVKHGRITTTFRVFFKRHIMLPVSGYLGVHGDVLIMRVASRSNASVVNMRSTDGRLADYVAKKWVNDFDIVDYKLTPGARIAPMIRRFQSPQRVPLPKQLLLVK